MTGRVMPRRRRSRSAGRAVAQRLADPQQHQVVGPAERDDGGQFADALGGVAEDAVLGQGGFEFGGGAGVGGDCNSHVNSNGYNAIVRSHDSALVLGYNHKVHMTRTMIAFA